MLLSEFCVNERGFSLDVGNINAKSIQNCFLGCSNCVINPVISIKRFHHLNLVEFPDCSRNSHKIGFGIGSEHFFLQKGIDSAPDDESNEFDEDLCRNRFIGINTDAFIAEIGFVSTEKLL